MSPHILSLDRKIYIFVMTIDGFNGGFNGASAPSSPLKFKKPLGQKLFEQIVPN